MPIVKKFILFKFFNTKKMINFPKTRSKIDLRIFYVLKFKYVMSQHWVTHHAQNFLIINCDWSQKFLDENLSKIEKNYSLFPKKNRWNCDCHVIHDDDQHQNLHHIDYHFLRNQYTDIAKKITTEFYNDSNFYLSDIWYSYYKKNQYQEPHTHDSTLTAVHFLQYNKKFHSPLEFTNSSYNQISSEICQGRLIIFPGQYEHFVRPNLHDFPRITIAFGITFV